MTSIPFTTARPMPAFSARPSTAIRFQGQNPTPDREELQARNEQLTPAVKHKARWASLGGTLAILGVFGAALGGITYSNSYPDYTDTWSSVSKTLKGEGDTLHLSSEVRQKAAFPYLQGLEDLGRAATSYKAPTYAKSQDARYIFSKAINHVRKELSQAQAAEVDKAMQDRQDKLDVLLKEAAKVKTTEDVEKLYQHSVNTLFTDQELPPDDKKELITYGLQYLQENQQADQADNEAGISLGVTSIAVALIGFSIYRAAERQRQPLATQLEETRRALYYGPDPDFDD